MDPTLVPWLGSALLAVVFDAAMGGLSAVGLTRLWFCPLGIITLVHDQYAPNGFAFRSRIVINRRPHGGIAVQPFPAGLPPGATGSRLFGE
jgi:hypothetical protein